MPAGARTGSGWGRAGDELVAYRTPPAVPLSAPAGPQHRQVIERQALYGGPSGATGSLPFESRAGGGVYYAHGTLMAVNFLVVFPLGERSFAKRSLRETSSHTIILGTVCT
jgi:hypothetical protein